MADKHSAGLEKVLMTTDTVGGIWTYALELSRQLCRKNVQVSLATMGKNLTPAQWQDVRTITGLQVYESNYKLEWMEDPWGDIEEAGRWLLELESTIRPDIVHLNSYTFGALSFSAPVLLVCHSCVYTWWQSVKKEQPAETWNTYYQNVQRGLEEADQLVAISKCYARQLAATYHVNKHKIKVIYNGLDLANYAPAEKLPYIFGAGRIWDEAKNYRIAEKIAPHVKWPVRIAGSTSHDGKDITGTFKNVELLGSLSGTEIQKELSEAAVFMLPAFYEPFGLSALEAALSGCALILADIPTFREIWQNAALYVNPDDASGWISSLNLLIDDEPLRRQLAGLAFVRAHTFNVRTMAAKYIRLYSKLKNQKPVLYNQNIM